ncbi:hypothetical protein D0962_24680 [Leptolyngbyaceae cyanobacterium CCMR0082]|uniref:Uncharacterized protein n=1 Tax=Adonisia turfae CCMR0082 TaxID=2304604 RepID=A0A6M0SBQ7_9CYAN|nr:hypothetical protein [Adonisia turfae]NEZ65917.1 hypothetical protein [Adonisia turfae CCMR0082]
MFNLPSQLNRVSGLVVLQVCCLGLCPSLSAKADAIAVEDLTRNGTQPITQLLVATATARETYVEEQRSHIQPHNYSLVLYPFTEEHQTHWQNLLWSTGILEPRAAYIDEAIAYLMGQANAFQLSANQRQTIEMAFQIGTQLYLSVPNAHPKIRQAMADAVDQVHNTKWSAMALSALAQGETTPQQRYVLSDRIRQRFPNWHQDLYLRTTLHDVAAIDHPIAMPPLDELLDWTIAPEQLHLYVLCSSDRGQLCQAVLKDRQGKFVREADGQLWSVPLGLRSLHTGLSWNFTRGETPQGIYRIEGTIPQPDTDYFRPYGQFALVQLFVPHEPGVQAFLPSQTKAGQASWSGGLAAYQVLLPPTWRNYLPIQQTYWAGKAGRNYFRIHGTGEDPGFFANSRRYPASAGWNPTIGCLSAIEIYDHQGRLQRADMPKILAALTDIDGEDFAGYLVVVNIPEADRLNVEEFLLGQQD